jgi:Flp pilus assembly protein TadD
MNRAESLAKLGNLDKALDDLTYAIGLEPENIVAHTRRGAVYEARKDLNRAHSDYIAAIAPPARSHEERTAQDFARSKLHQTVN